jgi:hypothetical protein
MLKEVVYFINAFQILPLHASASGCHLQWVVGALQATQVMLCVWVYTGYDLSSVATTTGHTGRIITRTHPNTEHYLSSL